jgi:hypothetical protein
MTDAEFLRSLADTFATFPRVQGPAAWPEEASKVVQITDELARQMAREFRRIADGLAA